MSDFDFDEMERKAKRGELPQFTGIANFRRERTPPKPTPTGQVQKKNIVPNTPSKDKKK